MRLGTHRTYRRGIGDCIQTGDVYNGVPYCRDNATGSLVPCSSLACGAPSGGGAPSSNSPTYYSPGNPDFATMPFGTSTTTTFTLDSYLAQRVGSITGVAVDSLVNEGIHLNDLPGLIAADAQQYCAAEHPPDCGDASALVAKYTQIVMAAFAHVPASQWDPATYTPYAYSSPTALNPPAPQAPPPPQAPNNPLAPPASGNPIAGKDTTGAGTNALNPANSTMGGGTGNQNQNPNNQAPGFDLSAFMHDYGLYIALGVGAIVLVPALLQSGRR